MVVGKIKGSIMTARPEGMDYGTYRYARKEQQKQISRRVRGGFLVWDSRKMGTRVGPVPSLEFK